MDAKPLRESKAIPPRELLNLVALAMLYGVIHFFHTVVFAYRRGNWRFSVYGLLILVYAVTVVGAVVRGKRWAWWTALGYSILYGTWNLLSILGWYATFARRRPVDIQILCFNIVAPLILGTLVVNLLRPATLQALRQQNALNATKAEKLA